MGELDKSLTVRKKSSTCVTSPATTITIFLVLPDNLVIYNCCKLSSTATKPSDFVNILISCIIFQPHSQSSSSYIFLLQRILILVSCERLNRNLISSISTSLHLLALAKTCVVEACNALGQGLYQRRGTYRIQEAAVIQAPEGRGKKL